MTENTLLCQRWVNEDSRSTVCQGGWLAGVAARAYLRLGLVRSSKAGIKAEATGVKKAEAP